MTAVCLAVFALFITLGYLSTKAEARWLEAADNARRTLEETR